MKSQYTLLLAAVGLAGFLGIWVSPARAGGCEVCHAVSGTCGEYVHSVCIEWDEPELGGGCSSWWERLCDQMALTVDDVEANGLITSLVTPDLVATAGETLRRTCDGAVLGYLFDAEDEAHFRSVSSVLTI